MSLHEWNRGLDDAYFDLPPQEDQKPSYYEGYNYGQSINEMYGVPQPQPEPERTIEDECASGGHELYGPVEPSDHALPTAWRCYCGKRVEL